MSEERKKVLAMLAEGKITADEAERLLQKLADGDTEGRGHRHQGRRRHRRFKHLRFGAAALPEDDTEDARDTDKGTESPTGVPKYLRVEVHSSDDDHVSVRVPFRLIRTGIKLTTMLPAETNAKLAAKGIDLSELGKLEGEELAEALRELKVDANTADGGTVRVFCE
jgi:hypothetical protein